MKLSRWVRVCRGECSLALYHSMRVEVTYLPLSMRKFLDVLRNGTSYDELKKLNGVLGIVRKLKRLGFIVPAQKNELVDLEHMVSPFGEIMCLSNTETNVKGKIDSFFLKKNSSKKGTIFMYDPVSVDILVEAILYAESAYRTETETTFSIGGDETEVLKMFSYKHSQVVLGNINPFMKKNGSQSVDQGVERLFLTENGTENSKMQEMQLFLVHKIGAILTGEKRFPIGQRCLACHAIGICGGTRGAPWCRNASHTIRRAILTYNGILGI